MPIVRRPDGWQRVAEAALRNVGIDAGAAQQTAAAAAQIVNSPVLNTGGGIELCLGL